MPKSLATSALIGSSLAAKPRPTQGGGVVPAGYSLFRVKQSDGSYSNLNVKQSDNSYRRFIMKAA